MSRSDEYRSEIGFNPHDIELDEIDGSYWLLSGQMDQIMKSMRRTYLDAGGASMLAHVGDPQAGWLYQKDGDYIALAVDDGFANPASLIDQLKPRPDGNDAKVPATVLFRYNTGGHWVLIETKISAQAGGGYHVDINEYNPMGARVVSEANPVVVSEVMRAVSTSFSGQEMSFSSKRMETKRQTDASSCGAITCDYLAHILRDEAVPAAGTYERGARSLRRDLLVQVAQTHPDGDSAITNPSYRMYKEHHARFVPIPGIEEKQKERALCLKNLIETEFADIPEMQVLAQSIEEALLTNARRAEAGRPLNMSMHNNWREFCGAVQDIAFANSQIQKDLGFMQRFMSNAREIAEIDDMSQTQDLYRSALNVAMSSQKAVLLSIMQGDHPSLAFVSRGDSYVIRSKRAEGAASSVQGELALLPCNGLMVSCPAVVSSAPGGTDLVAAADRSYAAMVIDKAEMDRVMTSYFTPEERAVNGLDFESLALRVAPEAYEDLYRVLEQFRTINAERLYDMKCVNDEPVISFQKDTPSGYVIKLPPEGEVTFKVVADSIDDELGAAYAAMVDDPVLILADGREVSYQDWSSQYGGDSRGELRLKDLLRETLPKYRDHYVAVAKQEFELEGVETTRPVLEPEEAAVRIQRMHRRKHQAIVDEPEEEVVERPALSRKSSTVAPCELPVEILESFKKVEMDERAGGKAVTGDGEVYNENNAMANKIDRLLKKIEKDDMSGSLNTGELTILKFIEATYGPIIGVTYSEADRTYSKSADFSIVTAHDAGQKVVNCEELHGLVTKLRAEGVALDEAAHARSAPSTTAGKDDSSRRR